MRILLLVSVLVASAIACERTEAQNGDPFQTQQPGDPFGSSPFTRQKNSKAPTAQVKQVAPAKSISTSEQKIHAALEMAASVHFIETPLVDVAQQLSDQFDIPIVIDSRAMEEIGLAHDSPIKINLRGVSLRSVLRLMLRNLGMTYVVKDEVLQFTTLEAAEQSLVIDMYRLPDNLAPKADQVIRAMTGTVEPAVWEALGGSSSVYPIDHLLVVSTTTDVHAQIRDFLTMLVERYEQ